MTTIKSYTDLEQSRKLAEILPLESSDHHYVRKVCDYMGNAVDGEWSWPKYGNIDSKYANYIVQNFTSYEKIPCWSLAALMKLLPSEFTGMGEYRYNIDIRKYALTDDVDIYQIAYGNYHWHEDGSYTWSDMINTSEREELIDAVFQMVIWLKENNKL